MNKPTLTVKETKDRIFNYAYSLKESNFQQYNSKYIKTHPEEVFFVNSDYNGIFKLCFYRNDELYIIWGESDYVKKSPSEIKDITYFRGIYKDCKEDLNLFIEVLRCRGICSQ